MNIFISILFFAGVYFQSQYHQIKFVDFCGKYRLPLMQYLCSPRCISYSSCSSGNENKENELISTISIHGVISCIGIKSEIWHVKNASISAIWNPFKI